MIWSKRRYKPVRYSVRRYSLESVEIVTLRWCGMSWRAIAWIMGSDHARCRRSYLAVTRDLLPAGSAQDGA